MHSDGTEFCALSHVTLTEGGEWDPIVLDHMLADDDGRVSKAKQKDDQECDSPHDKRGEQKHEEPVKVSKLTTQLDLPMKTLMTLKSTFMQLMPPCKSIKLIRERQTSTKCLFVRVKACLAMKLKPLKRKI